MNVIYFHLNNAPFITKDIEILKSRFNNISCRLKFTDNLVSVFTFLKQIFFILKNLNKNAILITQFAGYQSVIPTFIGKVCGLKNYIILGGTDCNWLPSINYGNYNKRLLRWATEYSLKNAFHLIPVNEELVECEYSYTDLDFKKQGFKSFIKNIDTPYTVIYNGIDIEKYKLMHKFREPKSFITICSVLEDPKRRLVKGIDLILEIALLMPDITITIIGGSFPNDLVVPKNIKTIPFLPNDQLPEILNKHQFYLQLSLTEGFPNAVIEAMACGCIPIVSSVGAMPMIVEDSGFVLRTKNIELLSSIIINALDTYSYEKLMKSRQKAEKFDIKNRQNALLKLLLSHQQ